MGFLKPDLPVVDFAEWSKGTRAEKIRPMARQWAEVGFGTPVALHLFYVVKILLYILGGWLFALATKGIDGLTNVSAWWSEPIAFQKVVLYTLLFEVIGLGCGFGPLNNRFFPPMGSILYWLRPNTIRQPPWPGRVPLTKGTARAPLVLFISHGGWLTAVAAFVMVCFHLAILTAIPMGVPLEWNVFMIFGVLTLFVAHADLGLSDLNSPVPVAILFVVIAGIVIAGNLFPRKISFLPGMRYYAGNWDKTLWCIKPSADEKIDSGLVAIANMPAAQLEKVYGSQEAAQVLLYLGYAFVAMNTHGRALYTLAHRAMAGQDENDYVLSDGERICSMAIGWNFGDGHMHNEQLIAAMQERCHFEPGEVRIVLLDAQPIHKQTQQYRLVDAATGEFESGFVKVADMVTRQPWDDDLPVHVDRSDRIDAS